MTSGVLPTRAPDERSRQCHRENCVPNHSWFRVEEQVKADYIVRAYQWAKSHWQPWIGAMCVIYISPHWWTTQDEQYWWAITNPDGTTRPAYEALKAMPK